jgi:hypothetical protein
MNESKEEYEEYFATDGVGKTLGYCATYDEAVNILKVNGCGKIYGAHWIPSKFKGLLHRVWSEVSI